MLPKFDFGSDCDGHAKVPLNLEAFCIAVFSPLLTEAPILVALEACSSEIKQVLHHVEHTVWKQACAVSPQAAYAPRCLLQNVASWREFLADRSPGARGTLVRVLHEEELREQEQLDWGALVAVIGPCRSGKSSLVERIVRQEPPSQRRCIPAPILGTGLKACVLDAFGLRGRLRLFEIACDAVHTYSEQLRKADALILLCDQAEGNSGVPVAMDLLASVETLAPPLQKDRPCFFVISKMDLAKKNVHTECRTLLATSDRWAGCEVVGVSAMDGSGIDLLLHLLAWRLLRESSPSRPDLLERGMKLLHRTAGAMNAREVLSALLRR
jgi:tRNA U34 5-carboxymethylaminomethyl modifying GTPase MnmE/TrmE